jgi:hypothetical protein
MSRRSNRGGDHPLANENGGIVEKPRKHVTLSQSLVRISAIIAVIIVLTYAGGTVLYDRRLGECLDRVEDTLPLYPDATLISKQQYTLTSPFGLVETWVHLQSEDAIPDVRAWYEREIGYVSPQDLANDPELAVAYRNAWIWEVLTTTDEGDPDLGDTSVYLTAACP